MPLTFNLLLSNAGLDPKEVSLLRHQDGRARRGRSIYQLWRDDRAVFEDYQSRQRRGVKLKFNRPLWASFVAAPNGETLFAGLYRVGIPHPSETDWQAPHSGEVVAAGADHVFPFERLSALSEFVGLLTVDWGGGTRSWVQRADRRDKPVLELRCALKEPDFPGYGAFFAQLSDLEAMPPSWTVALSASRGIYLLTCPRTAEQYVGAALGADGFLGRWLAYARSGHGGNVGLKIRDPSDYRVSILEVAASSASTEHILAMEALWKSKLQSREMGLNRN
ncbi:hypothetical protein DSM104635_03460 [Terricaulis silvestris]|uniref:GIY-YIG domain-containing protein n=2 Tax=Terricaulis silvestris TaxID=2686094 RepID=A0A6I6MMS2_9CAUL|nr:hypothetical protein DSM104635_03460 [Terricaulis silvestris]